MKIKHFYASYAMHRGCNNDNIFILECDYDTLNTYFNALMVQFAKGKR